jgi:hypothetical protein
MIKSKRVFMLASRASMRFSRLPIRLSSPVIRADSALNKNPLPIMPRTSAKVGMPIAK